MIKEWIARILEKRLDKKKREVIKLRWQKESLEKIKRQQEQHNN